MNRIKTNFKYALHDLQHNLLLSLFVTVTFLFVLYFVYRVDGSMSHYLETAHESRADMASSSFFSNLSMANNEYYSETLAHHIDSEKNAAIIIRNYASDWVIIVGSDSYLEHMQIQYTEVKVDNPVFNPDLLLLMNHATRDKYDVGHLSDSLAKEMISSDDLLLPVLNRLTYHVFSTLDQPRYLYSGQGAINIQQKNIVLISYAKFHEINQKLQLDFFPGLQFFDQSTEEMAIFSNTINLTGQTRFVHPLSWAEINQDAIDSSIASARTLTLIAIFTLLFYSAFLSIILNLLQKICGNMQSTS